MSPSQQPLPLTIAAIAMWVVLPVQQICSPDSYGLDSADRSAGPMQYLILLLLNECPQIHLYIPGQRSAFYGVSVRAILRDRVDKGLGRSSEVSMMGQHMV